MHSKVQEKVLTEGMHTDTMCCQKVVCVVQNSTTILALHLFKNQPPSHHQGQ